MCGRYTRFFTWAEVHAAMSAWTPTAVPADPEPAYNVSPSQLQPVILSDGVESMRWGLIPPWAKDDKIAYSTINARVESVATKPAFRGAWKHGRRCIVPASGYYEWPVIDGEKRPHFIHRADAPVILFGGLWEQRGDLMTYTIVTREADPGIAPLHDRMPLILPGDLATEWMAAGAEAAMAIALSAPEAPMKFYEVGKAVGNPRNQGPQLIQPVAH